MRMPAAGGRSGGAPSPALGARCGVGGADSGSPAPLAPPRPRGPGHLASPPGAGTGGGPDAGDERPRRAPRTHWPCRAAASAAGAARCPRPPPSPPAPAPAPSPWRGGAAATRLRSADPRLSGGGRPASSAARRPFAPLGLGAEGAGSASRAGGGRRRRARGGGAAPGTASRTPGSAAPAADLRQPAPARPWLRPSGGPFPDAPSSRAGAERGGRRGLGTASPDPAALRPGEAAGPAERGGASSEAAGREGTGPGTRAPGLTHFWPVVPSRGRCQGLRRGISQ